MTHPNPNVALNELMAPSHYLCCCKGSPLWVRPVTTTIYE